MEKAVSRRYEVQILNDYEIFARVDWEDDEAAAVKRAQELSHLAMTRVVDREQKKVICHFWKGYQVSWWDMVKEVLTGWFRGTK